MSRRGVLEARGRCRSADRGRLHATAYLLSQGELIRDLLEERVAHRRRRRLRARRVPHVPGRIADLADATGYDLSRYVPFDPLGQSRIGTEAIDAGEPLFVPLASLEQVVT